MKKRISTLCVLGVFLVNGIPPLGFAAAPDPTDPPNLKKSRTETSGAGQVYGIPTYDALFKYVLSEDDIRLSFLHAFAPDLKVEASERLDEHMNPVKDLQLARDFLNNKDTQAMVDQLKSATALQVGVQEPPATSLSPHTKATQFLKDMLAQFDDIKRVFPQEAYDGTMDFVCRLQDGNYALVEMQVIPQDYWDRRALAYVAAFYGNQLREGQAWKTIKRVIGINILGGGRDGKEHWKDCPKQYVRHYKIQEQIHKDKEPRYMDGFEIIQYSIMHAPDTVDDQEKQDWIAFLKRGQFMTEEEVAAQVKTPSVKKAFEKARIDRLPVSVKTIYEKEDFRYLQYAGHTQDLVTEATKNIARALKAENVAFEIISKTTGLTAEQIRSL